MLLAMAMAACLTIGARPVPEQSANPSSPGRAILTLADVLDRTRARSPLIEAVRARQRASVEARTVLPRLPNPVVELRGENFGPASAQAPRRDVFATVSQPFEIGGARRARISQADASIDLASADVTAAEWLGAFDIVELYLDAIRGREVLTTLNEQQQGLTQLVSILADRVREGVSAEADLHRFETEETRLTSQIARASIGLQSALLRLSAIVGTDIQASDLVVPVIPAVASADVAATDAVLATRPDVRMAAARVQRAEATLAYERARGIPDLIVTGGYKRTDGFDTAVAGVAMAVPVFDRNRVTTAQATGELSAARLELQQVRRQALADAQARLVAARELGAQAARIDGSLVAPATVVRSAARSAFVEGTGGEILQLVDAERLYGEAVREALELRIAATLAAIHARLSMGDSALP